MLGQLLRPVGRNVFRSGSRSYHPPAEFKQTTLNDLPVPQGAWQTHHDAMQKKYNLHLLIGVGFTIGTVAFAKFSGLIYLNAYPPIPK
ncbi:uncharacterized protein COX7B [Neodiprion pinetum]|uniref:Uncharacterized protein LOC107216798 n=1 Tax=Neodiprion lecontei TaxID=441921 RepID=A0A6J0B5Y8_NEOLC|nr:uncharacterized protein LOC107216798 [Neodiprion lecontei]XP_046480506.1 uncharacterized protein LOC124218122 [Neodiprion pinetum]